MNSMRRWICLFAAVVLAAFGLTTNAAPTPKLYTLQFVLHPLDNGGNYDANGNLVTPMRATVEVRNDAPPGTAGSNIGSWSFRIQGLTIADPQQIPDVPFSCPTGANCTLNPATNTVSITNLSPPIQAGETRVFGFYLSSCGAGTISAANTKVYNGSGLTGQQFAPYGGVPGFPPILSQTILCGLLACGEPQTVFDASFPSSSSPKFVTVQRASVNSNAACTTNDNDVSYVVSNTIVYDQTLQLQWGSNQPAAAFLVRFNTGTTATPHPRYAWLTDGNGNPKYLTANQSQACLNYAQTPAPPNKLPALVGVLNTDVSSTDKQIKVDTTNAAVAIPSGTFDVVIADPNNPAREERFTVTQVSGQTWKVIRGVGKQTNEPVHFTGPIDHSAGQSVVITYMPLLPSSGPNKVDPPYEGGTPALMCTQGTGVYDGEDEDGTTWFEYIDSGDAWANNS